MHHSYEGLERAGGTNRHGLLGPLRDREFRLLWAGMCVSLLGDGAFIVALAWQVYQLSDAPTAMGLVGMAMTVPTIIFLLVGGALSDRLNRRFLMLAADVARLLAAAALAGLSLTGSLEIWHVAVLVAVYGTGQAFFAPAFDAIVPDLVPEEQLAQANALDQLVRPIALRMIGPAVGGVLVGAFGAAAVFALDAVSFGLSALALLLLRPPAPTRPAGQGGGVVADLREGWRFVRERRWLWVTFVCAAIAYLLFMGPVEVLVPYVVKHDLQGAASDLGLIFGAGGLASIVCAMALGQLGLPRRSMTFMYAAWTVATVAVAGYGLGSAVWHLMLASALFNALETAGTIVWITAKQRHVPSHMLGRVSSLDWLISIGLLPLSFALTGPVSALIGAQTTLVVAGVAGAAVTVAGLFVPGVRDVERQPARDQVGLADPYPASA
ncbi:MAG TPA: MFS transporter [Solirubrobacteraceae bacterium]|jgi:DHA3 family tetracycline resistance protein-like MFS transporter|nr:MFS transporter [Solirubrobacteraceae bacterium]